MSIAQFGPFFVPEQPASVRPSDAQVLRITSRMSDKAANVRFSLTPEKAIFAGDVGDFSFEAHVVAFPPDALVLTNKRLIRHGQGRAAIQRSYAPGHRETRSDDPAAQEADAALTKALKSASIRIPDSWPGINYRPPSAQVGFSRS